jgi:RIO-like serine/threonine protein kinase
MTKDRNLELARLQKEIGNYIGLGKDSLVFNFDTKGKRTTLHVITLNPNHNQSFLFHNTTGSDKVDALREMLAYVKTYKERTSSYTVQWSTRGEKELQTSYFRAKNVLEALDKLFYDRDPNSITVFSVMLNPIT